MKEERVFLPRPRLSGKMSLEEAIFRRRSVREFRASPLSLEDISQVLWAAQGITDRRRGFRTAPSAGALYPLKIYLVAGNVKGLKPGVYAYLPETHSLTLVTEGDVRKGLCAACLGQEWVAEASASLVITAVFEKTTSHYCSILTDALFEHGIPRGVKYTYLEAGHAAQNVYLQATALGLGTVAIGAFHNESLRKVLGIPERERPIYVLPVGRPAEKG